MTDRTPKRWIVMGCAAMVVCGLEAAARADAYSSMGYTNLLAELGASMPKGTTVRVTHVEAPMSEAFDANGLPLDGQFDFKPDPTFWEFTSPNKVFTVRIPTGTIGAQNSGHATSVVGPWFYGKSTSMSKGVLLIEVFEANHFLADGLVNTLVHAAPLVDQHDSRVANHSYVGHTGSNAVDLELMMKLDWLVHRDNFIQVVGRDSFPENLLHSAFNVISVGSVQGGNTGTVSFASGGVYTGGRGSAEVVGYDGSTSIDVPQVASVATLLVEVGHNNPSLSNGSQTNRFGSTIYHAETAETMKAVLMAGADRQAVTDAPNGHTYTVNTSHGLDIRYGAGLVRLDHSYHILTGGEQNSQQDGGPGYIGVYGFDYDPSFGGSNGSNTQAVYRFSVGAIGELAATLAWHVNVNMDAVLAATDPVTPTGTLAAAASLQRMGLALYRITESGDVLIQQSVGTVENTQNIWQKNLAAGQYKFVVTSLSAQPYEWDYAMAWRIGAELAPVPEPSAAVVLVLGGAAMAVRRTDARTVRGRPVRG